MSAKITINKNGSLRIEGDFEIVDPEGKSYGLAGRTVISLCRCGQSGNKPFCDGSHLGIAFTASGEPATMSLDPLAIRDGPLHVDPQRDGPLQFSGNLEICSGMGRVVSRVTQAKLCRCGHSQSKPFCDGSHRAAGFRAGGSL